MTTIDGGTTDVDPDSSQLGASFRQARDRYHNSMMRLALLYFPDRPTAEEVVRDTWRDLLSDISMLRDTTSSKVRIFQLLIDRARLRGESESLIVPVSATWSPEDDPGEPSVDPTWFLPSDAEEYPHHWDEFPPSWDETESELLVRSETKAYVRDVIAALPPSQQEIIILRDGEGFSAPQVSALLGVSESNQRLLLHRARARIRRALEQYVDERRDVLDSGEDLTCMQVVEVVTEYLEGAMQGSDREQFEDHLYSCPGCRIYVDQIRHSVETVGRVTEDFLTDEVKADLEYLFSDWQRV